MPDPTRFDPETSNIQQLRKMLDELEQWQKDYDAGKVAEPPDQKVLEQIRTILTRRRRPTTRRLRTDGSEADEG